MALSDIPLNEYIFERVRWEEAVADIDEKECQRYSSLFFSRVKEAEAANDKEAQEAFTVLGAITSMMLNPDSREVVYRLPTEVEILCRRLRTNLKCSRDAF